MTMPATQTLQSLISWVMNWVAVIFAPEAPVHINPWVAVIIVAAAVGLTVFNSTWRVFGLFATLVHELGHAFATVLVGRRVTGITVRLDHSGSTSSFGAPGALRNIVTGFFGYPAPALVGLVTLLAVNYGYVHLLLPASAAAIGLSLLFIRNFSGALVVIGSALTTVALWKYGSTELQSYVLLAVGIALIVGAVRGFINVALVHTKHREQLETSDAYILYRATGIPSPVWLLLFAATIGWAVWVAATSFF